MRAIRHAILLGQFPEWLGRFQAGMAAEQDV